MSAHKISSFVSLFQCEIHFRNEIIEICFIKLHNKAQAIIKKWDETNKIIKKKTMFFFFVFVNS